MLVAAAIEAGKQREPVIEVVMGFGAPGGWMLEGSEPGERFQRLPPGLNARGTTYYDTGGMLGSSMPSM